MKKPYNLVMFCVLILCNLLLTSGNVNGVYEKYTIPVCYSQATVIVQFINTPRPLDYSILSCTYDKRDRNLDYWLCNCQEDGGETIIEFQDSSNVNNNYHIIIEYYIAPKLTENINQMPPSKNDIINEQNKRTINKEIVMLPIINATSQPSLFSNININTTATVIIVVIIVIILIVGFGLYLVFKYVKSEKGTISEGTLRKKDLSDEEVAEILRKHLGR